MITNIMTRLVAPSTKYKDSYLAYITELEGEERYPYPMDLEHTDFDALVGTLTDYSNGVNLLDWMVPNSTYWLVQGNEIEGCSHLRHELNDMLAQAGGHIGLGVRPSFRGRGLGKQLLNLTLDKALEKQIEQVHIHCHETNITSKQLIESVGARLDSTVISDTGEKVILRYIYRQDGYTEESET